MPSDDDDDDAPEQTAGNRRLLASEEDARRRKRARPRAVSVWKLCGINAFFLAYGAWISSFAIVTLPYESTRFFPDADAVALGGFMFIAGASQMSGPWAGYVSDRTRSAYGRRRPVLVKGAVVTAPSLGMLLVARTYYGALGGWAPTLYYVAFTATMLALNVMYTAASGIVPDMIPDDQTGQSNGVLAAMSAAGACMGFVYTMVYPDVGSLYWFYLALLATCVPITCYCATEESSLGGVASTDDVESSAREGSTSATVDFGVFVARAGVDVHDFAFCSGTKIILLALRVPHVVLYRHQRSSVFAVLTQRYRCERRWKWTRGTRATANGGTLVLHRSSRRHDRRLSRWFAERRLRSKAIDRHRVCGHHICVHHVHLHPSIDVDHVHWRVLRRVERHVPLG